MEPIRVGLVADPASPTEIARRVGPLDLPERGDRGWDIEVLSEAFTIGSEETGSALARLEDQARQHRWDLVVGLTELPLHDGDGRYLLVETDARQRRRCCPCPRWAGYVCRRERATRCARWSAAWLTPTRATNIG
jgi:hypothetical protein